MTKPEEAAARLREALRRVGAGLVERESLLETIALAAVAREHVLVIGPPGTAKSIAVRRFARATGGTSFEYLLGRFTEPGEIFGPVDLRRLREGRVEIETAGMLPEADVAFLDEVFLGSSAILNTLLGILQERRFRRGHTIVDCPLRVAVGAANALPDDESLVAFGDRFLLRVFVEPISDPLLEDLLEGGWQLSRADDSHDAGASLADLDTLAESARAMDLAPIRPRLAHAMRTLRAAGVRLSDRRMVKCQSLVAAAAALAGRTVPGPADLWPVVLAVPAAADQATAREALADMLGDSENTTLNAAAEAASQGPLARAARLADAGRMLLSSPPPTSASDEDAMSWRLRLEAVGREIDAVLPEERRSDAVQALRDDIARALTRPGE